MNLQFKLNFHITDSMWVYICIYVLIISIEQTYRLVMIDL